MTKLFHISIAALLLTACSNDPEFGPEMEPTPAQSAAITSTVQSLSVIAKADVQGEATGGAAIAVALQMQSLIPADSGARSAQGAPGFMEFVSPTSARRLALLGECAVLGDHSLVWTECRDESGYTINGTISWSPGHVEVDLHISGSSNGITVAFSLVGSITVSDSEIDSDLTVSLSYTTPGGNFSETIRSQIDVELTDGCISSGTMTVTASGSGPGARNGAVQVVWTACNTFRVRAGE